MKKMDEDRIDGTVRSVAGAAEKNVGWATGDTKTQAEGLLNQASGMAQDLYGQAKDVAADTAEVVKKRAAEAGDIMRELIEERPYTVAIGALFFGWLLGRFARRD
jgi:uncharacterized protein YjbJ (UPF0337 family)